MVKNRGLCCPLTSEQGVSVPLAYVTDQVEEPTGKTLLTSGLLLPIWMQTMVGPLERRGGENKP
jgi:hypothetical protein